jgi:hypothetical protein
MASGFVVRRPVMSSDPKGPEPTPLSAERIKAQAEFHLEWHLPKYGHAGDPCVACLGMTPCATEQLAVGALQQAATIEALQAEVTTLRTALERIAQSAKALRYASIEDKALEALHGRE